MMHETHHAMCGRFGFFELSFFIRQLKQLELPFEEASGFSYQQSWNIAPGSEIITLLGDHGRYLLSLAQWGLIPHWAREMPKVRPINARADSVALKPFYRHMLNRRHCLIPASGFYEWKVIGEKKKEPWYIHRRNGQPMAMAGLWDEWYPENPLLGMHPRDASGSRVLSCTIITTEANREMKPVHDRMPVILEPDEWMGWLESGKPDAVNLLNTPEDGLFEMYPVSTKVNNPRNSDRSCIERLGEDG
jgi:putative SOS response-associated peptidase YedK